MTTTDVVPRGPAYWGAFADGYADGQADGYVDGYRDGKADGLASCPDPGPMDEDTARVVQAAGHRVITQAWADQEPLPVEHQPAGPDYPAPAARKSRTGIRRRRHTPELLRDVAACYWMVGPEALPYQRADAVAEVFQVSLTTAGRYIRDARKAGILPPEAPPRRKRPRRDEPPPW